MRADWMDDVAYGCSEQWTAYAAKCEQSATRGFVRRALSDQVEVPTWLFLALCVNGVVFGLMGLLR